MLVWLDNGPVTSLPIFSASVARALRNCTFTNYPEIEDHLSTPALFRLCVFLCCHFAANGTLCNLLIQRYWLSPRNSMQRQETRFIHESPQAEYIRYVVLFEWTTVQSWADTQMQNPFGCSLMMETTLDVKVSRLWHYMHKASRS